MPRDKSYYAGIVLVSLLILLMLFQYFSVSINVTIFMFTIGMILVLFFLHSFFKEKFKFDGAIKDSKWLSPDVFARQIGSYSDTQLLSIIENPASARCGKTISIVYEELLKRGLCDEKDASAKVMHILSKQERSKEISLLTNRVSLMLTRRFLLIKEYDMKYGMLISTQLIRIKEIISVTQGFSINHYTQPHFIRVIYQQDGQQRRSDIFSAYTAEWKEAFEKLGFTVGTMKKSF